MRGLSMMEDKKALKNACTNPPEALSNHLQNVAPEPRLAAITRSFDVDSIPGILRIVYGFEGPEQQVKAEQRIIEMTPNLQPSVTAPDEIQISRLFSA